MALPGVRVPPSHVPKDGCCTKLPMPGAKTIDCDQLQFGQASDIGPAPTSRVYTRDYKKVGREPDDKDLITEALGNPLRL
jgi:hypothetical protein